MAIKPGQSYPITITRNTGIPGYNGPWRPQNVDRRQAPSGTPAFAFQLFTSNTIDFELAIPSQALTQDQKGAIIDRFLGYPIFVDFAGFPRVWMVNSIVERSDGVGIGGGVQRLSFNVWFGGGSVLFTSNTRNDLGRAAIRGAYAITSPGRTDSDGTMQQRLPLGLGPAGVDINIAPTPGQDETTTGVGKVESRIFNSQVLNPLGVVLIQATEAVTITAQRAAELFPEEVTDDELLSANVTIDGEVFAINRIVFGSEDNVLMEVVKTLDVR